MHFNDIRSYPSWPAFLAIGFAAAALLAFGPLNPPGGPVAPTAKPLAEIEPRIAISATNTPGDNDATPSLFKISQPGSYYLTGNITGVVGKHGIEIASSGVTLDLNGFDLAGVAGMGNFIGVFATGNAVNNITIRNGSLRDWGGAGIDLSSSGAVNCSIVDVRAAGNAGRGVAVFTGCSISGCVANANLGIGIVTSVGCVVSGCAAYDNTGSGFSLGSGCTISGCSAYSNDASGIVTASGATITGCSAYSNTLNGIDTSVACTIASCAAYSNSGIGIDTSNGCVISGCTARSNTLDGIRVSSSCIVTGNACSANGNGAGDGAGIHATGSDNRIEGNTCGLADRGIDIDASGNLIIRNSCSGNTTDWDIAANNTYGPIIDRRIPAPIASTPAVVGTSATSTLGTTDPNANFTY